MIVIENVMGLLSSAGGADFAAVCRALHEGGYRFGALEIDAALWLPQSRPRLFIVAVRADAAPPTGRPARPFHSERIRMAYAALDPDLQGSWIWWPLAEPSRRNLDLAAVLEPDDAVCWLPDAEGQALIDQMAPLHRARLEAVAASGERRVGAAYRRVRREGAAKVQRLEARFDGLAGCLRTPAGGSSRQFVIVCEAGRVDIRRLTAREAARLMGVSDAYILPRAETAGLKLMGDAVAVPVVRALGDGVLRPTLDARAAVA